MIFPVGTDAPLYHRPIATIGLIAANVGVFALSWTQFGDEGWERHMLAIGEGLRPLQWITHGFLHAGPFHLAGNMIFLWSFGLIIEGKLGFLPFLATYLGLQVLTGATIQAMLMASDGDYALGASGAIYGLIGIALIWAPMNELSVFYLFFVGLRLITGVKEVAISLFAVFYIAWELITLLFTGLTLSSALGHATGAAWGLAAGSALVGAGLVDCEDWDVFSLRRKRRLQARSGTGATRRSWAASSSPRRPAVGTSISSRTDRDGDGGALPAEARIADARRRVASMLDRQMATAALQAHEKAASALPGYRLDEADHLRLIRALLDQGAEDEAIRPMQEFIAHYPARAHRVRLRLAQYVLDRQRRPLAALRLLQPIPDGALPEGMEAVRRTLHERAVAMQAEGVLEIDGDV